MMDPVLAVQVRLIIANIVMPLFTSLEKLINQCVKQLWWLAFFNYTAVLFLLQFIGPKYTSASSAVTMIGLEPLLAVFVGHFFLKTKQNGFTGYRRKH